VRLDEPGWWYGAGAETRPLVRLLRPLLAPMARLYGAIVEARFRRRHPYRSRFPVICVGNFTAGGTGKTPLALLIAHLLIARGAKPAFLTRGYGGKEPGPVWVEEGPRAAWRFGDEPLLLTRVAPTLVARDREAGVRFIEESGRGISAVIMDDGLQNPALVKDLAIAVVDGARGLGNGEVFPAGPLRAPIAFQLGLVDAIVVREPQAAQTQTPAKILGLLKRNFPGPVLAVRAVPDGDAAWLAGTPVVAFAGIANPTRFFALLESLGARVLHRVAFPDHHVLSRRDAARLLALADKDGARLITTEKDWVRITGDAALPAALIERAQPLAIKLEIEERDQGRLMSLIEAATQHQGFPRRATRPPQL
jgi:tetraacyldisaccharide 4'-kinase